MKSALRQLIRRSCHLTQQVKRFPEVTLAEYKIMYISVYLDFVMSNDKEGSLTIDMHTYWSPHLIQQSINNANILSIGFT